MPKMRFVAAIIIAVVVISIIGVGVYMLTRPPVEEVIKVGAIVDMTGPSSVMIDQMKGMMLAMEEVNAKGGVLGRRAEIIFMDAASTEKGALDAAERLISEYGVKFILGPVSSGQALAISDITNKSKVIQVSTVTADVFTQRLGYPYAFRCHQISSVWAQEYVKLAKNYLGTKKLAILVVGVAFGVSTGDNYANFAKESGIEVVYYEKFPMETTDFTPYLTAIRASGADTLMTCGYGGHEAGIVRKYKALGLDKAGIKLLCGPQLLFTNVLLGVGEDSVGVWTSSFYWAEMNDECIKFNERFTKRFPEVKKTDINAFLGYEAARSLFTAIETAGTLDVDAVKEAMHTMRYLALSGPNAHYDETNNFVPIDVKLVQITGLLTFTADPNRWIMPGS